MPIPPVVAVRPFQSKCIPPFVVWVNQSMQQVLIALVSWLCFAPAVLAESLGVEIDRAKQPVTVNQQTAISPSEKTSPKLLAEIRVHTKEELAGILGRVNQLYNAGGLTQAEDPVIFLLHGEEARTLYKQHYVENRSMVDTAAKLSALGLVDIRVCETWADNQGLDAKFLQPFVDTVHLAPKQEKQLLKQGYKYF